MEVIDYATAAEMFDDLLDCEGTVEVAGIQFNKSTILKECDPVAYRCYLNDYVSSLEEDGWEIED
jgi:hypothetical protein